ncbi:hypothetical protein QBC47DRAFT_395701 [Echria macrotheca]|uniref:Uncharacterized protein n=1 Tax=Echria macrotheca TaxID=438768 RepID=A0AAJ0B277_9PEZI|nr:hypothetical protein QBC47DRAFT_395701 [Echria macrotheca]
MPRGQHAAIWPRLDNHHDGDNLVDQLLGSHTRLFREARSGPERRNLTRRLFTKLKLFFDHQLGFFVNAYPSREVHELVISQALCLRTIQYILSVCIATELHEPREPEDVRPRRNPDRDSFRSLAFTTFLSVFRQLVLYPDPPPPNDRALLQEKLMNLRSVWNGRAAVLAVEPVVMFEWVPGILDRLATPEQLAIRTFGHDDSYGDRVGQSPFCINPSNVEKSTAALEACKDIILDVFGRASDPGPIDEGAFWELYDISWVLLQVSCRTPERDPGFHYIRTTITEIWDDIMHEDQPRTALHEFFSDSVFHMSGSPFSLPASTVLNHTAQDNVRSAVVELQSQLEERGQTPRSSPTLANIQQTDNDGATRWNHPHPIQADGPNMNLARTQQQLQPNLTSLTTCIRDLPMAYSHSDGPSLSSYQDAIGISFASIGHLRKSSEYASTISESSRPPWDLICEKEDEYRTSSGHASPMGGRHSREVSLTERLYPAPAAGGRASSPQLILPYPDQAESHPGDDPGAGNGQPFHEDPGADENSLGNIKKTIELRLQAVPGSPSVGPGHRVKESSRSSTNDSKVSKHSKNSQTSKHGSKMTKFIQRVSTVITRTVDAAGNKPRAPNNDSPRKSLPPELDFKISATGKLLSLWDKKNFRYIVSLGNVNQDRDVYGSFRSARMFKLPEHTNPAMLTGSWVKAGDDIIATVVHVPTVGDPLNGSYKVLCFRSSIQGDGLEGQIPWQPNLVPKALAVSRNDLMVAVACESKVYIYQIIDHGLVPYGDALEVYDTNALQPYGRIQQYINFSVNSDVLVVVSHMPQTESQADSVHIRLWRCPNPNNRDPFQMLHSLDPVSLSSGQSDDKGVTEVFCSATDAGGWSVFLAADDSKRYYASFSSSGRREWVQPNHTRMDAAAQGPGSHVVYKTANDELFLVTDFEKPNPLPIASLPTSKKATLGMLDGSVLVVWRETKNAADALMLHRIDPKKGRGGGGGETVALEAVFHKVLAGYGNKDVPAV